MSLKLDLLLEAINELDNSKREKMLNNIYSIIKSYAPKAQKIGYSINYDDKLFNDTESKSRNNFINSTNIVTTRIYFKSLTKNKEFKIEYFKFVYELVNKIKSSLISPYTIYFTSDNSIVVGTVPHKQLPKDTSIEYFYERYIASNKKLYSVVKINKTDISNGIFKGNINTYEKKVKISPDGDDSIECACFYYIIHNNLYEHNTIYCNKDDDKKIAILFEYDLNGNIEDKQLLTLTDIANMAVKYDNGYKIKYDKIEFVPNTQERNNILKSIHVIINSYKNKINDMKVYKSTKFFNMDSDPDSYCDACDLCFIGKLNDNGEPSGYPDNAQTKQMNEMIGRINKILPKRYEISTEDYRGYSIHLIDTYK